MPCKNEQIRNKTLMINSKAFLITMLNQNLFHSLRVKYGTCISLHNT